MIKTAVPTTSANRSKNNAKTPNQELNPKSQFIGSTLSMSWQLAAMVLIPVVGGYKLDQHFNTLPLWTIVGFVIAMAGSALIIKKTFDEFNQTINIKDKK